MKDDDTDENPGITLSPITDDQPEDQYGYALIVLANSDKPLSIAGWFIACWNNDDYSVGESVVPHLQDFQSIVNYLASNGYVTSIIGDENIITRYEVVQ